MKDLSITLCYSLSAFICGYFKNKSIIDKQDWLVPGASKELSHYLKEIESNFNVRISSCYFYIWIYICVPLFVFLTFRKSVQGWEFIVPVVLVQILQVFESYRKHCFDRSCENFENIMHIRNFDRFGITVKNQFKISAQTVCGWDLCIKKYVYNVYAYEVIFIY